MAARHRLVLATLAFALVASWLIGIGRPADTDVRVASAATTIVLTPHLSGLNQPLAMTQPNDGTNRFFVVERTGRIRVAINGTLQATPFLDVSSLITSANSEQGLLGLAFHPSYATNGQFFIYYTASNGDNTLARFRVSSGNANLADPNSRTVLFAVPDQFSNHNGGNVVFGPDGFLYVGLGDGGSAGDPDNNAQNTGVLLGKLLRLDVNSGTPYAIPSGNPFASTPGARGEIWAMGLRNPWRWSFDRQTGDLWIADVGQGNWEEVDRQLRNAPGGANYQWSCLEGTHPFNTSRSCTQGTSTGPIFEYDHSQGDCSVTGGYVYRGSAIPSLVGQYVFSDYCTGRIWTLTQSGSTWTRTLLQDTPYNIASFAEDRSGELYAIDITGGVVYRINDGSAPTNTPTRTPTPVAATNTPTRTPTPVAAATNTPTRTPTPVAAATNTPTRTPTPVAAATNTPTRTPTPVAPATNTPTPTPPSGGGASSGTVTFDDRPGQDQPLTGEYPAGVIDWGTGQWFHSGPYAAFTTKSVGFNGPGLTSATFRFISPRRLVRFDFANGGTSNSALTASCPGQPTLTGNASPGQLGTLSTGWAGTCTSVTLTSSNGWDTNFDNIVFDTPGASQPTATPTPTPVAGGGSSTTVTFDDLGSPNRPLNGQYPSGTIDWGTNAWYLSAPWRQFTTNSVGFNGAGPTSASFSFVGAPRRLVRVDALNGGSGSTSITMSCTGQRTATFTVAAGQLQSLSTGWLGTCPTVTVTSSNGWNTNFDNFVIDRPLADLTITGFEATSGTPSQQPHLTFTILNQGTADAGPGTTFDIHVFADLGRPPTTADIAYAAHIAVNKLGPGASTTAEGDVFPDTLDEGTHTLAALVDGHNTVAESNESNNVRSVQVTITQDAPSTQTVTFDDLSNPDRALNGQYPSGVIDWGTNAWYLSSPWGGFTSNSVGFNGAGPTSASFAFVGAPRRLVQVEAYNGGSAPSTVTLACAGQTTAQFTVGAGQLMTLSTGWTGTCTTVTVTSSNGWDTNFDNLIVSS